MEHNIEDKRKAFKLIIKMKKSYISEVNASWGWQNANIYSK